MENERILEQLSLVIDLQPTSSPYEFRALCPFHSETHPSFYVNELKGVFYCFGCGRGGTLKTLLRLLNLSDVQPIYGNMEVLEAAQKFFRGQIRENRLVREILARQNRDAFIDLFGLGYAPADPNALTDFLRSQGFDDDRIFRSGLYLRGSRIPLLRNRITIPIRNINGEIVAFAGRAIDDSQKPKYVNTVFSKKGILFGADEALKRMQMQVNPFLVIVEGYFDAMSLLRYGYPAVATMSANLTLLQSRKVVELCAKARVKNKATGKFRIILMPDPDRAGLLGAVRAMMYFLPLEVFEVKIVFLPEGKDADELSLLEIQRLIRSDIPLPETIAEVAKRCSIHPTDLAKILVEVPPEMRAAIWMSVQKRFGNAYLRQVADEVNRLSNRVSKPIRKPIGLGLWELFLAAVLQGRITPDSFPDLDLEEVLPTHLRRIFAFATGQLSEDELTQQDEQILAKLIMTPIAIDETNLLIAVIREYYRSKVLDILKHLKEPNLTDRLDELRAQFWEALDAFNACQSVSTDSLLSDL